RVTELRVEVALEVRGFVIRRPVMRRDFFRERLDARIEFRKLQVSIANFERIISRRAAKLLWPHHRNLRNALVTRRRAIVQRIQYRSVTVEQQIAACAPKSASTAGAEISGKRYHARRYKYGVRRNRLHQHGIAQDGIRIRRQRRALELIVASG